MSSDQPSISVVVPVYNSEQSLPLLVQRLQPVLAGLTPTWEIILVNDGSRDRSWATIASLAAAHPGVRGLDLMRNYGQHNALLAGLRCVRYELVVTLDDDLQNPPEELPRLVAKLADGFDVVYGRPAQERHGLWRDLASQCTKFVLQQAMGAETARQISAFRAFRACLVAGMSQVHAGAVNLDVLLTWGTTRFASIDVRHETRTLGASNYTLAKLIAHALNMLTGFSILPLRLAIGLGLGCAVLGVMLLAYVIGRYLVAGTPVPGFPFLASAISLFSGVQLFALGIVGEYIGHIHRRTLGCPVFQVRQSVGGPP
jgi:glycosyltransferase involved in cell wall biosynthesis